MPDPMMMDLADLDALLAQADAQTAQLQSDYKHLKKKSDKVSSSSSSSGSGSRQRHRTKQHVRESSRAQLNEGKGAKESPRLLRGTVAKGAAKKRQQLLKNDSTTPPRAVVSPRVRKAAEASSARTGSPRATARLGKRAAAAAAAAARAAESKHHGGTATTGSSPAANNRPLASLRLNTQKSGSASSLAQNFVEKVTKSPFRAAARSLDGGESKHSSSNRDNNNNNNKKNSGGGGSTQPASLTRAMKRAEALELAKHRRVPSSSSVEERKVLHTAPAKLRTEKLPSIFSRPKLNLNSGNARAVVRRPKEAALVRKLPSLHS